MEFERKKKKKSSEKSKEKVKDDTVPKAVEKKLKELGIHKEAVNKGNHCDICVKDGQGSYFANNKTKNGEGDGANTWYFPKSSGSITVIWEPMMTKATTVIFKMETKQKTTIPRKFSLSTKRKIWGLAKFSPSLGE